MAPVSLMLAMEAAGSMVATGAMAMLHGAIEVVLLGTGKAPSYSSPDRPIAPFQRGFLIA